MDPLEHQQCCSCQTRLECQQGDGLKLHFCNNNWIKVKTVGIKRLFMSSHVKIIVTYSTILLAFKFIEKPGVLLLGFKDVVKSTYSHLIRVVYTLANTAIA